MLFRSGTEVEVTGKSEREIGSLTRAMLINLDRKNWSVCDEEDK